ncbi:hypothetical protein LUZ62_060258 [Rhynchospora pubera]|uniref:Late embryogenesis abundant protein Lea5 n=1 Tax=Rhynchospora pubera TaxID=906938 RepID=A0AAV8E8Q9_9POAL|nr:hypothetical protein LUZ62_060258 [Rhynchospora pubera]
MARALSTSISSPFKTLLSVSHATSFLMQRSGFAAAAAAEAVRRSPKAEDKAAAVARKRIARSADPHPWIPDPVTGCYRPANRTTVELDAAELRALLLTPKP